MYKYIKPNKPKV